MKKLIAACLLAFSLNAGAQGTSQEALLDAASSIAGGAAGTAGWTFQPLEEVSVTHLGAFTNVVINQGSVNVGLWSGNGTLLRSVTVTAASSLQNKTLYSSVEPLLLVPLQTYHIGLFVASGNVISLSFFDPQDVGSGSVTPSPLIQVGGLAEAASGFAFPAAIPGAPGAMWLGANAMLQTIPEPSTFALAVLGACGFFAFRRSNKI